MKKVHPMIRGISFVPDDQTGGYYRGFHVEKKGTVWTVSVKERKLAEATSETKAHDWVDAQKRQGRHAINYEQGLEIEPIDYPGDDGEGIVAPAKR